jgi:ketosteroid isomerase-like protein
LYPENNNENSKFIDNEIVLKIKNDSIRLAELDKLWKEVARTDREGDFEGLKAVYHEDVVVVSATGNNQTSSPISTTIEEWKEDLLNAKSGKVKANVEFLFSQQMGSKTTAFDAGIFHHTAIDKEGKRLPDAYIHFDMLLVKRKGKWLLLMEYQKSIATKEEWDLLK